MFKQRQQRSELMKNHYHITVHCSSSELEQLAKLTKSKATSIDLSRNTLSQTDRMLTKYHRSLEELKRKAIADIRYMKSLGFDVVRLKIEEVVSGFTELDVVEYEYLEGHIKVKSDYDLKDIDGFILSSNNNRTNTRFYNFRIRNIDDYRKVINNLPKVFQSNVVETEYERVIVDTNSSHDRWWG